MQPKAALGEKPTRRDTSRYQASVNSNPPRQRPRPKRASSCAIRAPSRSCFTPDFRLCDGVALKALLSAVSTEKSEELMYNHNDSNKPLTARRHLSDRAFQKPQNSFTSS